MMESEKPADAGTQPDAAQTDESAKLRELEANVRDQDDLERELGHQADQLLMEQADERDLKRIDRTTKEKSKIEDQILKLYQRLEQPAGPALRVRIESEITKAQEKLSTLESDLKEIQERIDNRHQTQDVAPATDTGRLPNESRRDYLIRTGKITPFSQMGSGPREGALATLHDALIDAEDERDEAEALQDASKRVTVSHRNLRLPGLGLSDVGEPSSEDFADSDRARKRRKIARGVAQKATKHARRSDAEDDDSYMESEESEPSSTDEFDPTPGEVRRSKTTRRIENEDIEDLRGLDDGNEEYYQERLRRWVRRRAAARRRVGEIKEETEATDRREENPLAREGVEEWFLPHPTVPDAEYDGGYRVPGDIFPVLFDYQKTGVQWLWELYQHQVGGIIGDEMGLGKTIQIISFLAGLHHSHKLKKPVIVVAPATVMKQWVTEFHRWWPPFRVSILHTSGSGMINVRNESNRENALNTQIWDPNQPYTMTKAQKMANKIVQRVVEEGHVLVTTYSGLQTYAPVLIPVEWECAILDEGHKIRNPNTSITIHCKELRTPHRLILSGTPMQNNLSELWSLFDFVFPMRLGTLVDFRNQFEFPIRQGGYANASNLQVQTAARCAETLKEAISPYLLQRFKIDVAADLPKKSEQVLFCKLSPLQRKAYEQFLNSQECNSILAGRRQVLYGVDMLRKICNHPDLVTHKLFSSRADYGDASKSGKMQVVKALLELWKDTGHKTLLFAQHRIMLNILEKFIRTLPGFNYRRMDGETPIQRRQNLVDEFNNSPDIHVFLLTTKVGGLGVNLTGADRVIIYDPDWNPSTDMQARERAWRLGQKREVTIYRLMTAGTIEEKIYHRQIFKQFLTNKVLKDPKQRQTFEMSNLHDLFSLGQEDQAETSNLFKTEVTYQENSKAKGKNGKEQKLSPGQQDVKNVEGVAAVEEFHNEKEEAAIKDDKEQGAPNSEARLMEVIFSQSGVHSALEHDRIVNGKKVIAPDRGIIEAEAKRLAAEAAEKLRKAEETARLVPVGTPTWTGQFGIAGRPEDRSRSAFGGAASTARGAGAGPSSASILANLANRTGRNNYGNNIEPASGGGNGQPEFLPMIRDYMLAQGGSVYTQMLIDHFNRFCTTPQRSAEFKEVLKTVAVLDKGGRNGRGKWSLKREYAKRK
ncbi:putative DNA repair protein Rhp26/Rad26 [Talaromyces proteolyticus]|uniref:DNA repair protein Rhp26/Rad26 n=1 Tax=Talaromyces proteolyticus TaxID=1131652 RepID=A0AAD4L4K0_9EURO|nr:putative DNA repair protein Rhp26/Rad26 [Talaromyces proteolyticus]KAH8703452.1 putative DNA repair protein Rhp26/Rad26 [Talaromyces proteolyticus]